MGHKFRTAFMTLFLAGILPAGEVNWSFIGPKGSFFRKGETVIAALPDYGPAKRIIKYQMISEQALVPGKLYRFSCRIDSPIDQLREMALTYRGRKLAANLGFYQIFSLKKGENRISVNIIPVRLPSPGDRGILALQFGLLTGPLKISGATLREIDLAHRTPLPFSPEWTVRIGSSVRTVSVPSTLSEKGMVIDLAAMVPKFRHRDSAWLENSFEMDSEQEVVIGCAADWYFRAFLNGKPVYSTWARGNQQENCSTGNHVFILPCRKGENLFRVEVGAGSKGWKFLWGTPTPPPEPIRFDRQSGYRKIDLDHLFIREKSALDLSRLLDPPAGKYGRVIVGPAGRLCFEKNPTPFRMFGYSSSIPALYRGPDVPDREFEENARRLAKATRAQGYNCFRLHGFDEWVMLETTHPMEQGRFLDRWDRLVAEMKKEGIYVQLVCFSFGLFEPPAQYKAAYNRRNMHKARMFLGCDWERRRFRESTARLLNHVNPYTGIAWKDEPAIALIEFYNEQTMAIRTFPNLRNAYPDDYKLIVDRWSSFLKKRYENVPPEAWPEALRRTGLDAPPIPAADRSRLADDYALFWYELIRDNNRWCEEVLRENGYPGLVNNITEPQLNVIAATWESLPLCDAHTYWGFPSNWMNPGSQLSKMNSPIGAEAAFFRRINSCRLYGRPFLCGEYNHTFWNPYQYELPLGFVAYAAFADWSSMMIHDEAVQLRPPPDPRCLMFSVGVNPVLRCGQFLAAVLFLRGDVAPARHQVVWSVDFQWLFSNGNAGFALSDIQNRIALVTGTGLKFEDLPPYAPLPRRPGPDLLLPLNETAEVSTHDWHTDIRGNGDGKKALLDHFAHMRRLGILPADNRSEPEKGIYQTDTGEILLNAPRKQLRLTTPKTEAVTLSGGDSAKLDVLFASSSTDSLVAAVSMDEKPLGESRNIVLCYATRAANTGMELEPDGKTMRLWGGPPVLVKTGRLKVQLKNGNSLRAWALRTDGVRTEELPLKKTESRILLDIDTGKLSGGAAVFFELAPQ